LNLFCLSTYPLQYLRYENSAHLTPYPFAMADTTTTDISASKDDRESKSMWANITSRNTDLSRWNKDWEKFFLTITSSEVYATMGRMFRKGSQDPGVLLDFTQALTRRVCGFQNTLVQLWDKMEQADHFQTAWLLLDEKERKRHLLTGLEKVCEDGMAFEDCRALCPEITTSSLLKLNGKAFIDFMNSLTTGIKGVGADHPYFLPSEWWDKAIEDLPLTFSEEFEPSTFTLLTLMRNELIGEFMELILIGIRGVADVLPFVQLALWCTQECRFCTISPSEALE
jgi:hypothetical protein